MKTTLLISIIILTLFSCAKNESNDRTDNRLQFRSDANVCYFYNDIGKNISFNTLTGEYEVNIMDDFEYRPFGEAEWIPGEGGIIVKVKCRCESSTGGGCDPWSSIDGDNVEVGCNNPCINGCTIKARIRTAVDQAIDEFDGGGEFRVQ